MEQEMNKSGQETGEMSTTQQEINDMEQKMRFEDADIDGGILRAVQEMGFETMSPIQEKAIPVLLEGRDIIGQAQTGTGKTAAFGIPMIQNTDPYLKKLQGIVLCPTRELAVQAAEEIRRLAKYTHGIKVLPVYGGQEISRQIRALSQGVQIVVGTPGRVMDHMRRLTIKTEDIRMIVLDEADEMLNMGFREDIETILADMPQEHQMALFSATMPKPILDITHEYQKDAEYIRVTPEEITVTSIKQAYYRIARKDKMEALCRLLDYYQPSRSLIFCNTKKMVDEMAEILKDRDYQAEGLHGDLSQHQRDMVMNAFRNGRCAILIATDVAARGIDVSGVDAVFNYDVPEDIEYYVHRIGRTGRAGKKGRSFTLVCGREIYKIRDIERVCHTEIRERKLPSPKDITRVKSGKVFTEAMEVMEQKNLESLKEAIIKCAEENGFTVLDLAAAFMQMKVGDEPEEIREEKGLFERRRGSEGSRGRRRRRGEEGSRDGRRREEGSRDRRNRTESGREERGRHRDKDEPRREERRRRERGQEGRNREERRESLRREWERENGHRRDRDRESARGEKKKAKSILSGVKLGKKS